MGKKKRIRHGGPVSIWVGKKRLHPEIDILKELCGVSSYNLDDQEVIVDDEDWKEHSISHMLGELSYSRSFIDDALLAVKARGWVKALYVVCQFDFDYDPKKISKSKKVSSDPIFLGVFQWNDDEMGE